MISIEPFEPRHACQLQWLVNSHLGSVVPGWALPAPYIVRRLERNPGQYVIDPWVIERRTLCALERERLVAAAHLLRYGTGPEVSRDYEGAGDIAWFLAWPRAPEAGAALLEAACAELEAWRVGEPWAGDSGLPAPTVGGVTDAWPHVAAALRQAGFAPSAEAGWAIYGGGIDGLPTPHTPSPRLALRRRASAHGIRFAAVLDEEEIGFCDWDLDVSLGGALPALHGWAELAELHVDERWRNRGVGTWLVSRSVEWLRLAERERAVLAVGKQDEASGADRFYERLGWGVFARVESGWVRRAA